MTSEFILLSFVILNLESVERGEITKIWISWEEKEPFRWNKNYRVTIWWKNKNLIKNSGQKTTKPTLLWTSLNDGWETYFFPYKFPIAPQGYLFWC